MRAQQLKRQIAFALSCPVADVQSGQVFGGREQSWIGAWAGAEVDRAAMKAAPKLRDVRIIAVEKDNAIRG